MPKLSLDDIEIPDGKPPGNPEDWAKKELAAIDLERAEAEIESIKSDTKAKEKYAERIFNLAAAWLAAVFIVVILQGFKWWSWSLSDNVVISLVAGATTGVIGLLAAVLAYIFRAPRAAK
jgi:hypothetical protein